MRTIGTGIDGGTPRSGNQGGAPVESSCARASSIHCCSWSSRPLSPNER
jgi:hypothetical protein